MVFESLDKLVYGDADLVLAISYVLEHSSVDKCKGKVSEILEDYSGEIVWEVSFGTDENYTDVNSFFVNLCNTVGMTCLHILDDKKVLPGYMVGWYLRKYKPSILRFDFCQLVLLSGNTCAVIFKVKTPGAKNQDELGTSYLGTTNAMDFFCPSGDFYASRRVGSVNKGLINYDNTIGEISLTERCLIIKDGHYYTRDISLGAKEVCWGELVGLGILPNVARKIAGGFSEEIYLEREDLQKLIDKLLSMEKFVLKSGKTTLTKNDIKVSENRYFKLYKL